MFEGINIYISGKIDIKTINRVYENIGPNTLFLHLVKNFE